MRLVFLVLSYQDPAILGRLTAALRHPDDRTFVHVDAKVDAAPFRAAVAPGDAEFLEPRHHISWGGFSMIEATLDLMRQAQAAGEWDYAFLLSGADYPVRPRAELVAHLEAHPGMSWLSFYAMAPSSQFWHIIERYYAQDDAARRSGRRRALVHHAVQAANRVLPARRFPRAWKPYRGSTYWCLSREVVDYVVAAVEGGVTRDLERFGRFMVLNDEVFFHTVVLNSPLAASVVGWQTHGHLAPGEHFRENDVHLHYIDWDPAREDPAVLVESDWPKVAASQRFFARKCRAGRSEGFMDVADQNRHDGARP